MKYSPVIKVLARDLFVHGFNIKEIAAVLKCSRQTVATWVNDDWRQRKEKYHTDYLTTILPFYSIEE